MNYNYLRPGIGNAASYQAAGIPWYTSSLAPALSTTSVVVNLPQVTKFVTIKNTSTTGDNLRFTFNNDSVVDNTNYVLLESGESFSADFRVTDIHLISDTETPVPFTIVNGLTNIRRQEMTSTTPVPPNLLAWAQKQKILADDPDGSPEGDRFGVSLSATGGALAISSYRDEQNGGSDAGAVYIFQNSSAGYQQVQKLTASGDVDPAQDTFGRALAFNSTGDILGIGARGDEENGLFAGSVYVFQSSSVGYQQVQKLTASGEASTVEDIFGSSLTFSSTGNILAIGAFGDEENGGPYAGAVYIFQSSSVGYQQVQKLTASGDADPAYDYFGSADAISISSTGDILAIGAYADEENGLSAGSVYIFQSSSVGYQQVQKLTASGDADPAIDLFGATLSLSSAGNILAVGAFGDEENGGTNAGSVYIFQSGSTGFQQVQKLTASGDINPAGDYFSVGLSLSPSANKLAVGSWADEENGGTNAGSVYVFQSSSVGYQQVQKLTASGDADPAGDRFGRSVSFNSAEDTVVIGAWRDDEGGIDAGAAYIFKYTRDY